MYFILNFVKSYQTLARRATFARTAFYASSAQGQKPKD